MTGSTEHTEPKSTLYWAPELDGPEVSDPLPLDDTRYPPEGDPSEETGVAAADSDKVSGTVLVPGDRLPNSRIEVDDRIGLGATAVVFRGRHVDLDRQLAIKVLKRGASWAGARERFSAEARLTCDLDSPYVVDVVDFGVLDDGRMWSAMELLDGQALADQLEDGPLSPERTIGLLRMACKGLHAAHTAGIVHRDIKPDNLMLVEKRGREQLVIVDFGIATSGEMAEDDRCGTPRYMAPEQIRGEALDGRADLYALGCCAYEMLTGDLLVQGEGIDEVLKTHLDGVEPVFAEDSPVPKPLQQLVARCLHPDPEQRPGSAAQLEAALCEAQLAADLRCPTDALPLPELDDVQRRRRLARGLARAPGATRMRRVLVGMAAAFCLTLAGAGWTSSDASELTVASAQDSSDVEQIASAARSAAEAGHFVRFGDRDAEGSYAYDHVVALERWDGPAEDLARTQARELRGTFATQLDVEADGLWEREGQRGKARGLYAQALVFDPTRTQARERVGMTDVELNALRDEADAAPKPRSTTIPPAPPASFALVASKDADTATAAPEAAAPSKPQTTHADGKNRSDSTAPSTDPERPTWMDRQRARAEVRRGRRAARRSDAKTARAHFKRALELDARRADAHAELADLDFDAGRHRSALRHARAAVRIAPRNPKHRLRLGDSYVRAKQPGRAKKQYERADAMGSSSAKRRLAAL